MEEWYGQRKTFAVLSRELGQALSHALPPWLASRPYRSFVQAYQNTTSSQARPYQRPHTHYMSSPLRMLPSSHSRPPPSIPPSLPPPAPHRKSNAPPSG